MHILIADDYADNRVLLRAILESRKYQVTEAANGLEAFDLIRHEQPNLVITDILMPEMDGFTLCRALKGSSTLRAIPLIFYTATYLNESDEALGLALGAELYIKKPKDPLQLLQMIEDFLEQRKKSPASRHRRPAELGISYESLHQEKIAQKLDKKIKDINWLKQQQTTILSSALEGIISVDLAGRHTLVNKAATNMLGYQIDELIGASGNAIWHRSEANELSPDETVKEVTGNGLTATGGTVNEIGNCPIHRCIVEGIKAEPTEGYFFRKDGSSVFVEYSCTPLMLSETRQGAVIVFRDITERKHAQQQMYTLLQAIEQSPVSVMIADSRAKIKYVNAAFQLISGYEKAEVIGQSPQVLYSGNTAKRSYHAMWEAVTQGKTWQGEFKNRKKHGEIFWENAHVAPVFDEYGNIQHYLAVEEDITLRKQQEEKIQHQAHIDALTDLPNRFLALDRLNQLLIEAHRNKHRVAVLFLDLDDFKKVNDTLGHEAGDKILIEASVRLSKELRLGDTVARLGGDEFVVFLSDLANPSDVIPVVDNLINRFRTPFLMDGRDLLLTASIGISIFPEDGDSSSKLLSNADTAMYHSKEQGRNTFSFFTDLMNQNVSRRLGLEEQMHGALDRGEFSVVYQPLIHIGKRTVCSMEALLRWNNAVFGNISPEEFIPIAENTSFIIPIGKFVLKESIITLKKWQEQFDPRLRMAINFSPRQFRDPDLISYIKEVLAECDVASASIDLEITEGVLMSGYTYIEKALAALSEMQIGIAMDDFGTGYSSLSYLRRYPFNIVKIDKTFIRDITEDNADLRLVIAAINMSHGMGLKTVAEGVETEEQLGLLAKYGCDYCQGYLFSRPARSEDVSAYLSSDLG